MPNQSKHIRSFRTKNEDIKLPKGKNYLLVIAIDDYENCPKLYNPVKDAKDLIALLTEKYDFESGNILTLFNDEANESNIIHKFRDIIRSVTSSDNLVIFFSGHGEYDDVFKEGFWIPVNAGVGAFEDYVPNSKIRKILDAVSSHHTFLIADSCFSGSLFVTGKDVVAERLAKDPSRWGLTAGRNEIVDDGQPGQNSPFADSILYHLKNNEKSIGVMELCAKVMEDVVANAGQTPRGEPLKVEGHRGGQFYFEPTDLSQPQGLFSKEKSAPRRGSLLHNIPEEMEIGKDTRCEVRIAFDRETVMRDLPEDAKVEIQDIRVSNIMEVYVLDPMSESEKAFQIRTFSQAEQFIEEDEYTQWVFYIKPLKSGTYPLILKVSVIEYIDGIERRRDIILEEQIEIVTELPEVFEAVGYKSATVSFKPEIPEMPKESGYKSAEVESSPPDFPFEIPKSPAPAAPSPSPLDMTKAGGGFNLEDVLKEIPAAKPAPSKKSMRGKLTAIMGVLVILLAAIMLIPNLGGGGKTDETTSPVEDKSDGDGVTPNQKPTSDNPTANRILGNWVLTEFYQNGKAAPVPDKSRIEYHFSKDSLRFSFQKDLKTLPYALTGDSLFWGLNQGLITFPNSKSFTVEGTNNAGTFKMVLER